MKVIQDKYEKKKIQTLPCVHFEGRIIVIFTERDAEKAVDFLMKQKVLGFDTETRPSFQKCTKWHCCKCPHMMNVSFSGSTEWAFQTQFFDCWKTQPSQRWASHSKMT